MNAIRAAVPLCLLGLTLIAMNGSASAANSFTIDDATITGITPTTMTVSMENDAPVQGFVLAIQHGSDVDVLTVDASGAAAAAGAELVVGEIFAAQNGFTLGVVLDATTPFGGQTIPVGTDQEIAAFDAQYNAGPVLVPTSVDFNFVDDTLNDPVLSNIQVHAGLSVGVGEGLALNGGTADVQVGGLLEFTIPDVTAPISVTCDEQCLTIPVFMTNEIPVQAYVLAIQSLGGGLTDIDVSSEVELVGAEFVAPAILGGGTGATLGVMLDYLPPYDGQTIAPGVDTVIATIVVCADPPLAGGPLVLDLNFVDGVLDTPPLDNIVVFGGNSLNPTLINGSATFPPCEPETGFNFKSLLCAGSDGPFSPIEGPPGGTVDVCFYYDADINVQGFQLAVCFDCALTFGDFSIEGSILESLGAEFVNWNVDNNSCQFVAGVLIDALPPFEGQTAPPTTGTDPLLIGCVEVTIDDDEALCDACLDVEFCNGATAAGSVAIENIMVVDFQSCQDIDLFDCCVQVIPTPEFKRGDCNRDDKCDLADSASILGTQFFGFDEGCPDACDANDDGKINLADSVFLMNFLFKLGDAPPLPGCDEDGVDPTDDTLDCDTAVCS